MLNVNDLRFSYTNECEMSFNLAVNCGEICAVLGQSGSGKSTLLSILAGFLQETSGSACYKGQNFLSISANLRPLSILLQQHNLFPQLNVYENIGLGFNPRLKLNLEEDQQIKLMAKKLGLEAHLTAKPNCLSGGQQQRVAIARALIRRRPILLLDEPFSALDPKLKEEMLILLKSLVKKYKLCVLMVTHSPEEAVKVADTFVLIKNGSTLLQAPINELKKPQLTAVLSYLGSD